MLSTQDYEEILTTLGGDPSTLTSRTEKDFVLAIVNKVSTIHTQQAAKKPTSADVTTAIEGMTPTQVGKVQTKIGTTSDAVTTAIEGMTDTQVGKVQTKLGITVSD